MTETKPNYKLNQNELFLSSSLLNNIIKNSTVKKAIIEEKTSELWYETYNGIGTIQFKNNMEYTGNLHYGIIDNQNPESPCTLIFPSGTKYIGTMINNEITGKGEYIFNNGSTYSGEVLNGLRHGKGIFKTADGILYDGDWKLGLKHGKGRLIQGEMELDGEWVDGVIFGKCRIKWKSGNIYDGEISENKMNGNGYMVWNDKNEKYVGKWEDNLQTGLGVYIWYDNKISVNKFFKDRYVGEWKEGKREGFGKFFYSNGSIYEGYWKNDKKEGFGILKFQDRSKFTGLFHNDIFFSDLKNAHLYIKNDNLNSKLKDGGKKLTIKDPKSRRNSFFTNINKPPGRINEKKQTKIGIGIVQNNGKDTKNFEEIKEKKDKDNDILKPIQEIKENIGTSIKSNAEDIKIKISIDDISTIEPFEKEMYKKLDDLTLRNLSLISKLYIYATWGDDVKLSEIGFSTGSPSFLSETKSKSMFKQQLQIKKERNSKDFNGLIDENIPIPNEEKKEINLMDNIYNNDLYFCLDLKNFWKLLRESGLINPKFSLAMIDRFIFKNPENQIDMFFIPEELEKLNNNNKNVNDIYNYLYQSILDSKKIFEIKYKSKIDLSNKILSKINRQRQSESEYLQSKEELENSILEKYFNYHDEKNIILLRYFYEILIRLAYLRFDDEKNLDIEGRLKKLFDLIKSFMKMRRKAKVDSSLTSSVIDPKLKNLDDALENYIYHHYETLKNIFLDLYKCNCSNEKGYTPYDMTITYRFFFDHIILNSEKLSELFKDKTLYIDLISRNFKDKKITIKNLPNMEEGEIFEYLEALYDYEMIFREFCELVFYISRKYFMFYNIDTKWEDNKMGLLVKEEEKKVEEDDKKNKKKKKAKKSKNIDIYMIVIDEIANAKNILIEKKGRNKKNKYYYPILKTHKIIERNEEERRQKIIEEKKKEMDIIRYENERKTLKEEDINIYKEDDGPKSNSDDESSEDD